MKRAVKKYGFLGAVLLADLLVLIVRPETGLDALTFTGRNFRSFVFMLTPIFILIGLMDVWLEREMMIRVMGERSGLRGVLVAFLLGVMTAVPIYALLPVAGVLLKKGSRISNVLIFLCSSASIRIPLLLFEVSSLGWRFTAVRFVSNIVIVLAIACIIDKSVSAEDKESIYENAKGLE